MTAVPTINIPSKIRFALYLLAAFGSLVVLYAIDKGWVGDPEFKFWTGLAGLLNLLAATKTAISDTGVVVPGKVEQTTTTTTELTPVDEDEASALGLRG